MQKGGGPAPTGCFKCGRPGHWSRDCPSSLPTNPNPNLDSGSNNTKFNRSSLKANTSAHGSVPSSSKKVPRTRPKLTPDLLLSEDGLGFVLKYFPKAFKYHGRGHEVADLGKLIAMYVQWHSRLIPYYSFDQFVQKVEKVGATRRVKTCLRELKLRVANGGDPSKLHEAPTEHVDPDCQPDMMENEMLNDNADESTFANPGSNDIEEMFNEIYQEATEEIPQGQSLQKELCNTSEKNSDTCINSADISLEKPQDQEPHSSIITTKDQIQISEEQRARMEANRLKALEIAAARRASKALTS